MARGDGCDPGARYRTDPLREPFSHRGVEVELSRLHHPKHGDRGDHLADARHPESVAVPTRSPAAVRRPRATSWTTSPSYITAADTASEPAVRIVWRCRSKAGHPRIVGEDRNRNATRSHARARRRDGGRRDVVVVVVVVVVAVVAWSASSWSSDARSPAASSQERATSTRATGVKGRPVVGRGVGGRW